MISKKLFLLIFLMISHVVPVGADGEQVTDAQKKVARPGIFSWFTSWWSQKSLTDQMIEELVKEQGFNSKKFGNLLMQGADPNAIVSAEGQKLPALSLAIKKNNFQAIDALLEHGADPFLSIIEENGDEYLIPMPLVIALETGQNLKQNEKNLAVIILDYLKIMTKSQYEYLKSIAQKYDRIYKQSWRVQRVDDAYQRIQKEQQKREEEKRVEKQKIEKKKAHGWFGSLFKKFLRQREKQ